MTNTTITLTANETAILKAWPNFQYISDSALSDIVANNGWATRSVWTWSFIQDAAAAAGITLRGASGVVASLKRKGLVTCENDQGEDNTITMTDAGVGQVVALQYRPEQYIAPAPGSVRKVV